MPDPDSIAATLAELASTGSFPAAGKTKAAASAASAAQIRSVVRLDRDGHRLGPRHPSTLSNTGADTINYSIDNGHTHDPGIDNSANGASADKSDDGDSKDSGYVKGRGTGRGKKEVGDEGEDEHEDEDEDEEDGDGTLDVQLVAVLDPLSVAAQRASTFLLLVR